MANEITREEWERRYAARLIEVSGIEAEKAQEFATTAATENLRNNGDEWLDPEDDADVELSYWENDGE
jgi:hypothetical protein